LAQRPVFNAQGENLRQAAQRSALGIIKKIFNMLMMPVIGAHGVLGQCALLATL